MPLDSIVRNSDADGIVLLEDMLRWNPSRRPTAMQSLKYNYFKVNQKLGPNLQQINNLIANNTSLNNNKTSNSFLEKSASNLIESEINLNGKSVKYDFNESPNLDNNSIQQLQQQIQQV